MLPLVFVRLVPTAVRLGAPEDAAGSGLLIGGFCLGITWGLAMRSSPRARAVFSYLTSPIVTGLAFWCIGLFAGMLLLLFGLTEEQVDPVPICFFGAGAIVGLIRPVLRFGAALGVRSLQDSGSPKDPASDGAETRPVPAGPTAAKPGSDPP